MARSVQEAANLLRVLANVSMEMPQVGSQENILL